MSPLFHRSTALLKSPPTTQLLKSLTTTPFQPNQTACQAQLHTTSAQRAQRSSTDEQLTDSTPHGNRNAAARNFNSPPGTSQNPEKEGTSPAMDPQSNASQHRDYAGKQGDDHPAKQPDPQAEPDRYTGFNEGGAKGGEKGGVKGGKEGLGERTLS